MTWFCQCGMINKHVHHLPGWRWPRRFDGDAGTALKRQKGRKGRKGTTTSKGKSNESNDKSCDDDKHIKQPNVVLQYAVWISSFVFRLIFQCAVILLASVGLCYASTICVGVNLLPAWINLGIGYNNIEFYHVDLLPGRNHC